MAHPEHSLAVPDPSDWLKSTAPKLAPVESALRCQVCKDFYDTPMITSCSHTFCSLCIRRCLTNDGKCPTCRAPDQELRLRRNWTVHEIVDAFQLARPSLMSLSTPQESEQQMVRGAPGKRKIEDRAWEEDSKDLTLSSGSRKTRSQGWQQVQSPDSATPSEWTVEGRPPAPETAEIGLAACPICCREMREEAVFLHLDTHIEPKEAREPQPIRRRRSPSLEILGRANPIPRPPERLPQLNYSLMKDNALRKKLSDMGIPSTGPRALLIRRHAEWVNIVNANADSSKPKTKREMLRELEMWDRSTGRSIVNGGTESSMTGSVMNKDFDGAAWSTNYKSDFEDLIVKARCRGTVSRNVKTNETRDGIMLDEEANITDAPTNHDNTSGGALDGSVISTLPTHDVSIRAPSAVGH